MDIYNKELVQTIASALNTSAGLLGNFRVDGIHKWFHNGHVVLFHAAKRPTSARVFQGGQE
jgi:hypothetical protein